ncbi:hypothetical protein GR157_17705 [Burkholderia sp. 4701]|nr:hypothetical protein [Burkholderia sp. 4701]MXN83666.1 hypothetical protein [Burkholderia sp. 4812]
MIKCTFICLFSMGVVILTGCADGMARIHAAGDPVVRVSSDDKGAFGKDVRRIQAPQKITKGRDGECWDYRVSAHGSGPLPYYVVVDANDRVGSHNFRTCEEAKKLGEIK